MVLYYFSFCLRFHLQRERERRRKKINSQSIVVNFDLMIQQVFSCFSWCRRDFIEKKNVLFEVIQSWESEKRFYWLSDDVSVVLTFKLISNDIIGNVYMWSLKDYRLIDIIAVDQQMKIFSFPKQWIAHQQMPARIIRKHKISGFICFIKNKTLYKMCHFCTSESMKKVN